MMQSLYKLCVALSVTLMIATLLIGQERPGFRSASVMPPEAGLARQNDLAEGVTLTMCITDLRKTLVHDATGRLVADARSLTLEMPRFGEQPVATCKMYLGVYEPTGAAKKTWPVREIRLVEDSDFQKLVDSTATPLRVEPTTASDPTADIFRPEPEKTKVDRTGTIPLTGTPKN